MAADDGTWDPRRTMKEVLEEIIRERAGEDRSGFSPEYVLRREREDRFLQRLYDLWTPAPRTYDDSEFPN